MWQPVLSTSVWEFVIGNLVETVVKRLIDEILAFDDISVAEGELVWCLLHPSLCNLTSCEVCKYFERFRNAHLWDTCLT